LCVLPSFAYLVVCRLFAFFVLCFRSSGSKELEIVVLRHELSILRRQAKRTQLREADRVLRWISIVFASIVGSSASNA
jgi:putative transposase